MVKLSLILCILFICSSCLDLVVSGSFNYAEEYGFDISQDDLKALITDFKEENGYVVPFTDNAFKERYAYMDYYAMYTYSPVDSTCFNVLVFNSPKGNIDLICI